MDKIILGYEKFSDNGHPMYTFNGRYLPNSITYPNSTVDLWNPTLKHWFKELITPEKLSTNEVSLGYLFGFVNNNKLHEHKPINEIEDGTKYFYPIHILSMFIYANYVSEISISPKVRNDVLKGNANIVFIYATEGDISNFTEKFSDLVSKLELPKKHIFLLHGDLESSRYVNEPYTYIPINEMHWWLYHINAESNIADASKIEKLYLCYNRTLRNHKLLFLAHLVNSNLIDFGIISAGKFGKTANALVSNYVQMSESATEIFFSLSNSSPDNKKFPLDNPAQQTSIEHYDRTFLTITVETLEIPLFFSEKTYKPILHRHPFIIVGTTGMLKKLKSFGFKTFDKWWDESYDDEQTMNNRIIKIIEVLSNLNKLSIENLKQMRDEMSEVLDYNYKLLQNMYDNKDYHASSEILRALINIQKG